MLAERIKQARKASGLSTRALAEKVGVSAMAISKYENGKASPSSGILLKLADALDVRVEYFFRPIKVQLKEVEYRKHSKLPKKVLGRIEGEILEQVERAFELEQFLPQSVESQFQVPGNIMATVEEYADIETVAMELRKAWELGVGPIPVLTDALEERGIKVFLWDASDKVKFDGMAATVDGTPIVVVGTQWPGDRQRFTLAHELGHLILKGRLAPHIKEEMAANRFAGAFLVPASEVLKELGQRRKWLEPKELYVLKMAYGLSMGGWLHRAQDLGVISDEAYRMMVGHFRSNGWHLKEPGNPYPPEKPQLFVQMVLHALSEELISESKAAELLRMPIAEFHKLRNMESAATSSL